MLSGVDGAMCRLWREGGAYVDECACDDGRTVVDGAVDVIASAI